MPFLLLLGCGFGEGFGMLPRFRKPCPQHVLPSRSLHEDKLNHCSCRLSGQTTAFCSGSVSKLDNPEHSSHRWRFPTRIDTMRTWRGGSQWDTNPLPGFGFSVWQQNLVRLVRCWSMVARGRQNFSRSWIRAQAQEEEEWLNTIHCIERERKNTQEPRKIEH